MKHIICLQTLGQEVRDGDIPESEAAKIAIARMNEGQSHDRGWYRINATRMLTGGRKLIPKVMSNFQEVSINWNEKFVKLMHSRLSATM
jgi:hypothetical protein